MEVFLGAPIVLYEFPGIPCGSLSRCSHRAGGIPGDYMDCRFWFKIYSISCILATAAKPLAALPRLEFLPEVAKLSPNG